MNVQSMATLKMSLNTRTIINFELSKRHFMQILREMFWLWPYGWLLLTLTGRISNYFLEDFDFVPGKTCIDYNSELRALKNDSVCCSCLSNPALLSTIPPDWHSYRPLPFLLPFYFRSAPVTGLPSHTIRYF